MQELTEKSERETVFIDVREEELLFNPKHTVNAK